VRRVLPLLVLLVVLAGCGGGGAKEPSWDLGGGWKLSWTAAGSDARIEKDGKPVDAGGIRIGILGPKRGATVGAIPQVAVEVQAPQAVTQVAVLVDGTPLDVKSGSFGTATTVYGAPASSLSPGRHVAVAAAQVGESAAAVAWPFTVR
jgi:hypothetical protein